MSKKQPEPATPTPDEDSGHGGSYEIRNGKRVRVEAPTLPPDHPDHPFNQARRAVDELPPAPDATTED